MRRLALLAHLSPRRQPGRQGNGSAIAMLDTQEQMQFVQHVQQGLISPILVRILVWNARLARTLTTLRRLQLPHAVHVQQDLLLSRQAALA